MSETGAIVIVGGGHAAAQLCAGLVGAGQGARVHLVCEESELPYQRPPLSKSFLKAPTEALQSLRGEPWYRDAGITVHLGDPARSLDRAARRLRLRSGHELSYEQLVLATGARSRMLASLPAGLGNVAALRGAADAYKLREQLAACQRLTVLGGGFIGLEIAATAAVLGKQVTLLESAPRLLSRSVSAELAEHVLQTHRGNGVDLRLGVQVGSFEIDGEQLKALSVDGQREAIELLVLGIGAEPETRLAAEAGLACGNGVLVDECLRSSDPAVLAIGDCANFVQVASGQRRRLESVQNANDQGRTALATLLGQSAPYRALPWFWSDQGSMRLQMAGLIPEGPEGGQRYRRPGASPASFSMLHYADGRLACVESVNAPLDHMAARKLMEAGVSPEPAAACDGAVPLKAHL